MMLKHILLIMALNWPFTSLADIKIAGSKTVYLYATILAEDYIKMQKDAMPIIEATGSGHGIHLLCQGKINIAASSRRITSIEADFCAKNNIAEVKEYLLGQDAIVIAASRANPLQTLNRQVLYKALVGDGSTNYNYWDEIDRSLPHILVKIYGPYFTSGTKHSLFEKLSEGPSQYITRTDGGYIEILENPHLIVRKLLTDHNALAILSYGSFLNHQKELKAIAIDNILPNSITIQNGTYPLLRNLYFYYNKADKSLDLVKFLNYLAHNETIFQKELIKMGLVIIHN